MSIRQLALFPLLLMAVAPPLQAQPAGPAVSEIKTYLQQIKESHNRLYSAGQEFGQALLANVEGNDAGHAKLNTQFRSAVKTLGVTLKETRGWKVPDADVARKLEQANEEFLEVQLDLTLIMLSDLMEVAQDEALTTDDKRAKISEIIQEGGAREQEIGAKVNMAWNRLAAEYEIEIDE